MSNQLVIVKQEYVQLVREKCQQLNQRTTECAAKLIHYFLNWTSWKKTVHRTVWVYQKLKQIYADFFGLHSLHCIRAAIASLMDAGILARRNNPGNFQDKTYQYRVNMQALKLAKAFTEAEESDLNSEDSIIENQPYNPTIESTKKIPSIPEERKKESLEKSPKDKISQCTPVSSSKKEFSRVRQDDALDKSSANVRSVFQKYEDRLKLYNIRFQRWNGIEVVECPRMRRALANLSHLSGDAIERGLKRFLGYIDSHKNVNDIYALMVFEIKKGVDFC